MKVASITPTDQSAFSFCTTGRSNKSPSRLMDIAPRAPAGLRITIRNIKSTHYTSLPQTPFRTGSLWTIAPSHPLKCKWGKTASLCLSFPPPQSARSNLAQLSPPKLSRKTSLAAQAADIPPVVVELPRLTLHSRTVFIGLFWFHSWRGESVRARWKSRELEIQYLLWTSSKSSKHLQFQNKPEKERDTRSERRAARRACAVQPERARHHSESRSMEAGESL
ncbi:hypothetical protein MHYP_G00132910 [Metynnis hypsauchen]